LSRNQGGVSLVIIVGLGNLRKAPGIHQPAHEAIDVIGNTGIPLGRAVGLGNDAPGYTGSLWGVAPVLARHLRGGKAPGSRENVVSYQKWENTNKDRMRY